MLGDLDRLRLRKSLAGLGETLELLFHPATPRNALGDELEACAVEIEQAAGGAVKLRQASAADSSLLPERPALSLAYRGKCNIHYLGIPQGPELLPFIEALLGLPKGAAGHAEPWVVGLAELRSSARLFVFVSATCPHCPQAVRSALKLSLVSYQVQSVIIDAERYQRLARRFSVRSVPTTVIDEGWSAVGVMPPEELCRHILERKRPDYSDRVFDSLLDAGRLEEAAERVAGGELNMFARAWERASFTRRMGLMLVAERLLRQEPRSLDSVVEKLIQLLQSADSSRRGDTADLLGRIGHPAALPSLQALLADPNPDVAEVARQALEEISPPPVTEE